MMRAGVDRFADAKLCVKVGTHFVVGRNGHGRRSRFIPDEHARLAGRAKGQKPSSFRPLLTVAVEGSDVSAKRDRRTRPKFSVDQRPYG